MLVGTMLVGRLGGRGRKMAHTHICSKPWQLQHFSQKMCACNTSKPQGLERQINYANSAPNLSLWEKCWVFDRESWRREIGRSLRMLSLQAGSKGRPFLLLCLGCDGLLYLHDVLVVLSCCMFSLLVGRLGISCRGRGPRRRPAWRPLARGRVYLSLSL